MACLLCLEMSDLFVELMSEEGIQQNVEVILMKHFRGLSIDDDKHHNICLNCWHKVKEFDEFYVHIENIHQTISLSELSLAEDIKLGSVVNEQHNKADVILDKTCPDSKKSTRRKRNTIHGTSNTAKTAIKQWEESLESSHTTGESRVVCDGEIDVAGLMCDNKVISGSDFVPNESVEDIVPKRKKKSGIKFPPRHLNRQYIIDKTPHRCDICNIWLSNANKFYRHNKQYHLLLDFKCTFTKCIESYATNDELLDHMKCHQKHACTMCGKAVINLRDHRCHNVKEFICEICGKKSNTKSNHESHYESKHMNMTYDCDICGQRFNTKSRIKFHITEKHVKTDKSVACNVCGKIFKHKKSLTTHLPVHFDELKKYKCSFCGKRYSRNEKLKEHETIHTGLLPLQCAYCDKRFRFSSALSFHRKKVHLK